MPGRVSIGYVIQGALADVTPDSGMGMQGLRQQVPSWVERTQRHQAIHLPTMGQNSQYTALLASRCVIQ